MGTVSTAVATTAPSSAASPLTTGLSRLVLLQQFRGNWLLNAELASVIGIPLESLKHNLPSEVEPDVWATAIAIAVLQQRYAAFAVEWELLAKKATRFINSIIGSQASQLIDMAALFWQQARDP